MKLKKPYLVEVVWVDCTVNNLTWESRDEPDHDMVTVHSAGYVLKWDKKQITLCTSHNPEQVGRLTKIPTGCILKVHRLKKTKKLAKRKP